MTQADDRLPPSHAESGNAEPDDEMLPEYDLSHLAQGIRGKYADAMRQGYSVTVHHENGTSTTRCISPDSMSNDKHYNWYGDRIAGDKIGGDKVGGDKVGGDKVGGDKVGGDKTVNYNASTAELLQLIATLRQTATQFPPEIQTEITIDLDDVETEIKKPEDQRNLARLKKRLIALAMIGAAAATPIAGITDFANNALDLGSKLGIELPLPSAP